MRLEASSVNAVVSHIQHIYQRVSFIKKLMDMNPSEEMMRELDKEFHMVRRSVETVTFGATLFPQGTAYVYVLDLENGKYYVGWSECVLRRLDEHFSGDGSLWTKTHRPVAIRTVFQGTKEDEKMATVRLVHEKGFDFVRGGPWCKMEYKTVPEACIL